MHTYKLTIAYDGTQYSGWQVQPNANTVQAEIVKALKVFLRVEKVVLIGSGRTDAGVHAAGQIAHFKSELALDLNRLQHALNGILPRDIRIKKAEEVPDGFHSQYHTSGKEYHYHLYLDRVMDPFKRLYCWHLYQRIDLDLLRQAAQCFVGKHDFSSFANESDEGSASRDPVRTLYRLDVEPFEGGVRLEFEGDGFLYKMVRNIVGTLVDMASGKRPLTDIAEIFAAKDRCKASMAAPPQGLFLMRVDYEEQDGQDNAGTG